MVQPRHRHNPISPHSVDANAYSTLPGLEGPFSRSLPITGRRFSTPIRAIRPLIMMVWW